MKPILLPDEMTVFHLPAGHDQLFPQSGGAYPIKKFVAIHMVTEALYNDKTAFDIAMRAAHDDEMDKKGELHT